MVRFAEIMDSLKSLIYWIAIGYIFVGMLGFNLDVGHYIFGDRILATIFGFALTIWSFQLAIKGLDEYRGKQANKQSPL